LLPQTGDADGKDFCPSPWSEIDMRSLVIWAALVAGSACASTPALAALNERATLLLEDQMHHPSALKKVDAPESLSGPVTWIVSPDGARVTAQFEIPGHLKGSIDFLADKTLASPSRAIVVRLDLLDPGNDPIANVLVPSVDALGAGPRLKGVITRRDDKTFDVHLDEAEAAPNAKAIDFGNTIDVAFRLKSGRVRLLSIRHDAEGAQALARLFPHSQASEQEKAIYKYTLAGKQAEADAAQVMFGNASSGSACYARVYDSEHFRSHPRQHVVAIAMSVQMVSRGDSTKSPWPSTKAIWNSTKAIWTFTVSATLRNGVAAGAVKAKVCEVKRALLTDYLHDELFFGACGAAVEDAPDRFSLTDDGRHAVYGPLDENGMGAVGMQIIWPDSEDPALRDPSKTDDDSFQIDRADPSVCADIARRAHSATKMIVRQGFGIEE